ncbi:SGNH/GDSL hydrolase family protein [Streptomyces sp. ACA25]|uniref:SGNH/GDSL hydrolase family protein n=1 Tax=Streptomyces sp. ACA25 TaxID=3022596 RepID=UPI002307FD7A|nr:SGNH/GDSL hydrolase family protein [Streptomyces sp. ACA25]MDB1089534.1 SGNH/GDSL hydrolase family protein [Streptomyces sp. ACA25]
MRSNRGYGPAAVALTVVLLGVTVSLGFGQRPSDDRTVPGVPSPRLVVPVSEGDWVGTWATAPAGAEPGTGHGLPDRSLRNVLRTSVAGASVRVELSNRYGTEPLPLTRASVALAADGGPAARPGSVRRLTFRGESSPVLAAGTSVVSDPVPFAVQAGADLLVTVYVAERSGPVTYHRRAGRTNYAAAGDQTGDVSGRPFTETTTHWRYVTGVQVLNPEVEGAVVMLGDSLTDGISATFGAHRGWPDLLAVRLRQEPGRPSYAVLNKGLSGNRLLTDAAPGRPFNGSAGLRRLHTDVLPQPGVRTVVVQLGINDIIRAAEPPDPGLVVAGLRQLATEARERGLWVAGATLAPFRGHSGWSAEREAVRERVNEEIRAGTVFDAVVDLDAALRDPLRPDRLLPEYDSGDHLHPNDAGFRAMAVAVEPEALVRGYGAAL